MGGIEIERQSSIEMEPLTLNINQIDFAREAARYVVNTRSIEEALSIFTEGLEPVVRCVEYCDGELGGQSWHWNNDERIGFGDGGKRDIASAPF